MGHKTRYIGLIKPNFPINGNATDPANQYRVIVGMLLNQSPISDILTVSEPSMFFFWVTRTSNRTVATEVDENFPALLKIHGYIAAMLFIQSTHTVQ